MYRLVIAGLMVATAAGEPDATRIVEADDAITRAGPTASSVAPEQREWDWRGRVQRGKAIEIRGVNGEVRAEPASGDQVEVHAELTGKRSDPDEIEMVVLEHANGVTICAVYPTRRGDEPNECRPGGRGRNNVQKNDVSVDFVVRVPTGVNFTGHTVNGEVEVHGLTGDVRVGTVNGDVDISTNGLAEASTVNGSITVTMGKADWNGVLDFSTVNGSVILEMPDELNAELSVSTVNGHISSDYPLTVDGKFSPRHVKGTIGQGGRTLIIKTVNGSIQLRRS